MIMKNPKHDISNVFIYISRSNEKKLKYAEGELTVSTPYSFDKMILHQPFSPIYVQFFSC